MRLIDADALIEVLATMQGRCSTKAELVHNSKVWQQVKDMPTIDAVPVIRCKDCKWYYRGGATCMFWDGANGMCGDDFCGKAEREEE